MDKDELQLQWRGKGKQRMVSDECTRDAPNEHYILCRVHLQLDRNEVELWVCRYELQSELLAIAED